MQIYNFCHIVDGEWRLLVFGWGNNEYYLKTKAYDDNTMDKGKKFYLNKTNGSSKAL
jgi:hypothetical protein